MMIRILKNTDGFTLVQALFVLIVLALLGAAMMRMIGVQSVIYARVCNATTYQGLCCCCVGMVGHSPLGRLRPPF